MSGDAAIGWLGALMGAIGFGSFAVPIKGEAADSVDVDPLVMQSYKTMMCFLTSWLVLLMGQEFSFTWWGVISGLFWVPSGCLNIFAIRNAGLAISQGIVSSTIVMVSFIWGNLIFQEEVKSDTMAYFAICQIMTGLWGMSYFSSGEVTKRGDDLEDNVAEEAIEMMKAPSSRDRGFKNETLSDSGDSSESLTSPSKAIPKRKAQSKENGAIVICGNAYSRRNVGLGCASLCGTWGGSCLVPMHYSTGNTSGLGYVISFSVGASLVTISFWILRFSFHFVRLGSMREAYEVLPSFHFRVLCVPGALAGSVWSLGNVGSIIAVEHLGQGVGYSSSQSALLVSGMWGMFYFKEVRDALTMTKWFLAAFVTIGGILLLGYESHVEADE